MPHLPTTVLFAAAFLASAATAQDLIMNPSFEDGWSGWTDVDPDGDATSISGDFHSGAQSAKITLAAGQFEQNVTLLPGSEYVLRAMVRGPGVVGVNLNGEILTSVSQGDADEWLAVEVAFESGDATEAVLFGAHNGDEGRFDDFELVALSGPAQAAIEAAEAPSEVYATLPDSCDGMAQLGILSAVDDGSNDGHTPDMAIDGNFQPDSRWSSEFAGKELILDMGEPQTLKELGLAFYKGDERQTFFSVSTSIDGQTFVPLMDETQSDGSGTTIQRFDFDDRTAQQIKITGLGNSASGWNSFVEVQAFGCGAGEIESQGDGSNLDAEPILSVFGLATNRPPSENFDLSHWKITLPVDLDGDDRADEIEENELNNAWSDQAYFYTDGATGGMVFRVFGETATTPNSSYARSELREMLRGGDDSIATRNDDGTPNLNNWVFSSAPPEAQAAAGGVDGTLRAQLAVNQVTRLGDASRLGRVIIGQIHARDGEPIRLYYRKLPTNKFGSIYYIHELEGRADVYVPIIGGRDDHIDNPVDGIALDEQFGYEISVVGQEIDGVTHPILNVTIIRDDGTEVSAPPLDMIDSNYSGADEFMYFKAGAYSQNASTPLPDRDFDQVTFFALETEH